MHSKLGIVWVALWLAVFGIHIIIQYYFNFEVRISVLIGNKLTNYIIQTGNSRGSEIFESIVNYRKLYIDNQQNMARNINEGQENDLEKSMKNYKIFRIVINVFWIALWINAIIVGVLVMKCKDRGLCQY